MVYINIYHIDSVRHLPFLIMHPTAAPVLASIEAKRQAILTTVSALSPAQRASRADPKSWSPTDIIEHLVLAEQVVLGDLSTAAARPDLPRRPLDRVRLLLVSFVLTAGIKVKVPARAMRPTGTATFESLCERWDSQHRALREFVGSLDDAGLKRRPFRHPVSGALSVIQALKLLDVHLSTHQRQLKRLP